MQRDRPNLSLVPSLVYGEATSGKYMGLRETVDAIKVTPVKPDKAGPESIEAYSLAAAARAAGIGLSTLRKLIKAGRGPEVFHIESKPLILRRELKRWLKARAQAELRPFPYPPRG
jgi:hypothetical protein